MLFYINLAIYLKLTSEQLPELLGQTDNYNFLKFINLHETH